MIRRKRKAEPEPSITVTSQLGLVEDKERAKILAEAIERSVQKANARVAREREEAARDRRQAS